MTKSLNIPRLHGARCDLCIFRTDDAAVNEYVRWLTDESILGWISRNAEIYTFEDEKRWALETAARKNKHSFNIVGSTSEELIGNCAITVVPNTTSAYISIFIGEPKSRRNGYGTEALNLLLKYGFDQLGLRVIFLDVKEDNVPAIKTYKKVGFVECGRVDDFFFYNGTYHAKITMQILEKEWRKMHNDTGK